jgi:hypothetical protein
VSQQEHKDIVEGMRMMGDGVLKVAKNTERLIKEGAIKDLPEEEVNELNKRSGELKSMLDELGGVKEKIEFIKSKL